jgi:hypothetical protein
MTIPIPEMRRTHVPNILGKFESFAQNMQPFTTEAHDDFSKACLDAVRCVKKKELFFNLKPFHTHPPSR